MKELNIALCCRLIKILRMTVIEGMLHTLNINLEISYIQYMCFVWTEAIQHLTHTPSWGGGIQKIINGLNIDDKAVLCHFNPEEPSQRNAEMKKPLEYCGGLQLSKALPPSRSSAIVSQVQYCWQAFFACFMVFLSGVQQHPLISPAPFDVMNLWARVYASLVAPWETQW